MTTFRFAAALTAVVLTGAVPAQAVVTTFAQFQAIGPGSNLRWVNSSAPQNGTGGSLFTIASQASTVAASRAVSFSFVQPSIAPFVTDVTALFTLSAAAPSGNPAQLVAGSLVQPGIAGSFSFVTTAPIVINNTFYASGSNLLSGTFAATQISGQRGGSSGSFFGSTGGGSTISYTSDFLSFAPGSAFDFSLSLTSIFSVLQATPTSGAPTNALRSFRANATGQFSSDPAPIVTAVPEPATWGLMILGFGLVGIGSRRRVRSVTV